MTGPRPVSWITGDEILAAASSWRRNVGATAWRTSLAATSALSKAGQSLRVSHTNDGAPVLSFVCATANERGVRSVWSDFAGAGASEELQPANARSRASGAARSFLEIMMDTAVVHLRRRDH